MNFGWCKGKNLWMITDFCGNLVHREPNLRVEIMIFSRVVVFVLSLLSQENYSVVRVLVV